MKGKVACLSVLRTSTAEQAQDEKTGLPAQRREIDRWLKSNDFPPASREIIDVNISAADLMNLKIGNVAKEIASLKKKKAKPGTYALCFANSARMSRAKTINSLTELLRLIKSGIDIIFCLQNIHVTALDDENTMQMKLMFALSSFQQNRQELLTLSRRTKGVWEENRKKWQAYEQGSGEKPKGQPLGLTCWWHRQGEKEIEVRKHEAKLVKKIYNFYTKENMTMRGIASHLNNIKEKNPVSRKKRVKTGELVKSRKNVHGDDVNDKWASSSIKHVLTNRTVIGEFECWEITKEEDPETGSIIRRREKILRDDGTHLIIKKYCPPIIRKTQFFKAQALIQKNKNTNKGQQATKNPRNIFRGLLSDGYTAHSVCYTSAGGNGNTLSYRSSVQKHRGEKSTSFAAVKFEESFFKIYSLILTDKDLFSNWVNQLSVAGSGRAARIAVIEEEIKEINEGNDNLLAMIERGKVTNTLAERIESNNRKKEILTNEKIKLEASAAVTDDSSKQQKLLGSMAKYCLVESRRAKVANILGEIGIRVSVWAKGLNYNEKKMLQEFSIISPELGEKNNWINFNKNNFEKYPFFFIQEFLYWQLAKCVNQLKLKWKTRDEALLFLFEAVELLGAKPVQNFANFYDIKTQPEKNNDMLFVCNKPDGTFFSGILNTSKRSQPVIKCFTNSPMFQTVMFREKGKNTKFSFLSGTKNLMLKKGIMDAEEDNMEKLLNKITDVKKWNVHDSALSSKEIPPYLKRNIINRRMISALASEIPGVKKL